MIVPVLAPFVESFVQIRAYDPLVQLRTSNVLHAIKGILMGVIFNKAESAWGFLIPIQTHNQALDFTAPICIWLMF